MALKDEYYIMDANFYNTSMLYYNELIYKRGDDDPAVSSLGFLDHRAYIHDPLKLVVTKEQKEPAITDFMWSAQMSAVLHNKLLSILLPLKLPKTQHFPTQIKDRKGVVHKEYFLLVSL